MRKQYDPMYGSEVGKGAKKKNEKTHNVTQQEETL